MKIKYEFVTGETVEVEVNDTFGSLYVEMERIEENEARRIRYNERHIDTTDDHGSWNEWKDSEEEIEIRKKFDVVMDELTDEQKDLIDSLFGVKPMTEKEYGEKLGISQQAVHKRLQTIRKKIQKKFLKHGCILASKSPIGERTNYSVLS